MTTAHRPRFKLSVVAAACDRWDSAMTDLPTLKIKTVVNFPASAVGRTGIDVERQDGNFYIDLAFADFAPPVAGVTDPAHQNALLWNSLTGQYVLAPVSVIGAGGGVPEAPNDGTQYARQSLTWTPVERNRLAIPTRRWTVSRRRVWLSRFRVVITTHPSDTSRAPLASPNFTGNPTAPTPLPGDSDTSIATDRVCDSGDGVQWHTE